MADPTHSIDVFQALKMQSLADDEDGHAFCPALVRADEVRWRRCQRSRARRDRVEARATLETLQRKIDKHGEAFCDEDRYKGLLADAIDDLVCLGSGHEDQQDHILQRWDLAMSEAFKEAKTEKQKQKSDPVWTQ